MILRITFPYINYKSRRHVKPAILEVFQTTSVSRRAWERDLYTRSSQESKEKFLILNGQSTRVVWHKRAPWFRDNRQPRSTKQSGPLVLMKHFNWIGDNNSAAYRATVYILNKENTYINECTRKTTEAWCLLNCLRHVLTMKILRKNFFFHNKHTYSGKSLNAVSVRFP